MNMAHEGLHKGNDRLELEKILNRLEAEDINFSYKDATDSPKSSTANRIDIFYNLEKIGEVWDPRPYERCLAMIYSRHLTNLEKDNAVDVYSRRYAYGPNGTRVWNRHVNDMEKYRSKGAYHYNIPVITESELISQIKSLISVYKNSLLTDSLKI